MQITSQSKSSTKNRFWNRSFHILSCEHEQLLEWSSSQYPKHFHNNINDEDNDIANINNSENSICRLDRKEKYAESSWSRCRCNWKSFLASIIIVLLHLTSIECIQARQEGK